MYSSAISVPHCDYILFSLVGPRNVSITPKKMTYSAGDVLRCSAAGNPSPAFEWTEIGSAYYVNGTQLNVSGTVVMKPESSYRCTAVNNVAGQRKIAYATVVIKVSGSLFKRLVFVNCVKLNNSECQERPVRALLMHKCIMVKVGRNEKHRKYVKTRQFYEMRGEI